MMNRSVFTWSQVWVGEEERRICWERKSRIKKNHQSQIDFYQMVTKLRPLLFHFIYA